MRVFLDERSAAFFALGLGKAGGGPAAVVTTSGTAVANLLPAAVEASQAEAPLLLVTADRPPRLRGADANQAIDQVGLFGAYVRFQADLERPVDEEASVRHLRAVAARAVAAASGLPAGPVHVNVPFDKPLEPAPGEPPPATGGRPDGAPWVSVGPRRPRASAEELAEVARSLVSATRGLIVAGPHPEARELGPELRRLAAATGFPLAADPLSGGRHGPEQGAAVLGAYDLVLRDPAVRMALRPDLVLRVGQAPTSTALLAWLEEHDDVPQMVVDADGRWKDHLARASRYLRADPVDAFRRLHDVGLARRASAPWRERWRRLDRAAAEVVQAAGRAAEPHEGGVLAAVTAQLPEGTPLFVSSSMPVRDLDAFGGARPVTLPVFGNRGASGIDGIVSTALGVAAGCGRPAVAVLGDLALFHDVNGLLATREPDARVVFVVINNDGGGIFHMLPVRDHEPEFTPYFATPHGLDPASAAALYGVAHRRVEGLAALTTAVAKGLDAGQSVLLEIRTDREANRRGHDEVVAAVRRAVTALLDDDDEEWNQPKEN